MGNKCDMPQEISEESIQQFCKDRLKTELSFYVSAKSGENAFEAIVAAVHRKKLGVIAVQFSGATKGDSEIG